MEHGPRTMDHVPLPNPLPIQDVPKCSQMRHGFDNMFQNVSNATWFRRASTGVLFIMIKVMIKVLDHDKQQSFFYKNIQIHQFCNKYALFLLGTPFLSNKNPRRARRRLAKWVGAIQSPSVA